MNTALIGSTGFVGSTLLRQRGFDQRFRSSTIADIRDQHFDLVVCAGAPAQKWIANQQPNEDRANIEGLMQHLQTVHAKQFVLISTVDVFKTPNGVDERTKVEESGLHPYGLHRRMLESFVEANFPEHLIVRLPGLVGPGLRKNVVYDLLHDNNLSVIDARAVFQFYPMVNLWYDIQLALDSGLSLVHLTAEPIAVGEVARSGFGIDFTHQLKSPTPSYDMRTVYAEQFGAHGWYQYSARETLQAVRAYAQSEINAKIN